MYEMNGTEGCGFSARQSSVFIPKPGSDDGYYLFTMEEDEFNVDGPVAGQPEGRGLSYFELDQTLNGGLGGVVLADQRVLVPSYEGLCAIRHSNEDDFWIVANSESTGQLAVVRWMPQGYKTRNSIPRPAMATYAEGFS